MAVEPIDNSAARVQRIRIFHEEHGDCDCYRWCDRGRCNGRVCKDNPHIPFYCPRCGEVSCGMKRQGKWIVLPHYRENKEAWLAGEHGGMFGVPCTGGEVDRVKDKAP